MTREELFALAKGWAESYGDEHTRWAFDASDVAAVSKAFLEADVEREKVGRMFTDQCSIAGRLTAERDAARAEVERLRGWINAGIECGFRCQRHTWEAATAFLTTMKQPGDAPASP